MLSQQDILNYLTQHKKEFQEKYNIEKIGLFGSYARGEAHKDSDIDIYVKMPPKMFKLIALKQQIEDDLKKSVDILREHKQMKPFLLHMIQKDINYV
jgi:predicted nucleotidyltransferase